MIFFSLTTLLNADGVYRSWANISVLRPNTASLLFHEAIDKVQQKVCLGAT
jgi:hypothetical protein